MTTPAGWYDDGSGSRRWWDGSQWTEHVVTAPQPAPVEPTAAEPAAEPAGVPTAGAESEPFAPPYMIPSSTSVGAAGVYAPAGGVATYPAAMPGTPPPVAAAGPSVLGLIGLAVVVIGVVAACIPVIAIAGWGLLSVGFVLSLVSLFLRGRKWPGITGMAVAAVGAILALAVSLMFGAFSTALSEGSPLSTPGERPQTDDGSTSEEGVDPSSIEGAEMVPFAELEVGDCLPLVDYGDVDEIYELPVVPCDQPHTDEVFFIFDLEDGEFAGEDAVGEAAWDGCLAEFESFVGTSYEASALDVYTYQPTKASWVRAGDRTVQCILFSYEDVTGTLQDAGY